MVKKLDWTKWTDWHERKGFEELSLPEDELSILKSSGNKLLDLACGKGAHSIFLAKNGFNVTALDFTQNALDFLEKRSEELGLKIKTINADISKPLNFPDSSFDVVFSFLGLHYFIEKVTRELFSEISRVLKKGGIFYFTVRSPQDRRYGRGREMEKDMFDSNGHIRHFFREEYIRSLLDGKFRIIKLEHMKTVVYGNDSCYYKVITQKL